MASCFKNISFVMSMEHNDTFRHKGLRLRLVQELRNKGITDNKVLNAIGAIPRHLFLDSSFVNFAYQDKPFPIAAGQTISQPYTVALQTQLLELKPNDKVLEVGTGSGYQAAVLMQLGMRLFSIERQRELYTWSTGLLTKLGYSGRFFLGDGYEGLPTFGPFDKIIVTAGAPELPRKLLIQLKIGGIMIIPIGGAQQIMTKIVRLAEDDFEQIQIGHCAFVPMLAGVVK